MPQSHFAKNAEGTSMNCPFCGGEMEEGFLRCDDADQLRWAPKGKTASGRRRAGYGVRSGIPLFRGAEWGGTYCIRRRKLTFTTALG